MAEGLTKKQIKELRKLEKMQSRNLDQKTGTVKWIAIAAISAIFLLLFVGIIIVAKNKNKPQTTNGSAQFANNGHSRMMTKEGKDATNSANPALQVVTMVEYGDFQCPACKSYHPVVNELLKAFPERLKLIFKNYPLTQVHPNAMAAAIAAEAVGKQGKFFQFVDNIYDKQEEWAGLDNPQSKFEEYVKSLGMNVDQFKKDQNDPAVTKLINDERDEGVRNVIGQFTLDQLLSKTSEINTKIKDVIDTHTEPWGAQVTAVEIKDITLPDNMQRAMAKEAEAERERRAKIVAAEGEFQAAEKLGQAADLITKHPVALQLRTLQTMAEISVEKNSTIIFPAQFMSTVQEAIKMISKDFKK